MSREIKQLSQRTKMARLSPNQPDSKTPALPMAPRQVLLLLVAQTGLSGTMGLLAVEEGSSHSGALSPAYVPRLQTHY